MIRYLYLLVVTGIFFLPGFISAAETVESALAPDMTNPGYQEKPAWFKGSFLDIREDVAEAKQAGKRVMLYFYQDGCPYCKKLLEQNLGQKDIVEAMRTNLDVIAINIWGDREVTDFQGQPTTEKKFSETLRVMFTPTILLLDEAGQIVLRINGYYAPHKFLAAINYVAERGEKKGSFREYYARIVPEPATGKLHQQSDYIQPPYRLSRRGRVRPLLVLFEQKDCAPCDELHLDIFKRAESRELLDQFDIALLDIWSKTPVETPDGQTMTAAEWARKISVQYAPSLVFFEADGKEVFRAEAYFKAFHTQSVLNYVASKAYQKQPNFQRYIAARADKLEAQGIHIDLMK